MNDGIAFFWTVAGRETPDGGIKTAITFHVLPLTQLAETRFQSLSASASTVGELADKIAESFPDSGIAEAMDSIFREV